MKHQWLAYVIVAILSIGAGVAIAGLPDSVPESATIVPPSTTVAPEPTLPTTIAPPTTTESPATTEAPTTTAAPRTTTTTAPTPTSTTTIADALPTRADVAVAVANGSGRNGVAVATAAQLATLGYANVAALTGLDVVDETVVYYAEGNDAIAERMAADLGLPPEAVALIDVAPAVQDLGIVQLLVYVGADRA